MERSSGILLPIFSLPSLHGIGTLGQAARDFIDFLGKAGQRCSQGIYVIVNWHNYANGDPNTYKKQAVAFFTRIALSF